uniref:DUF736 domain-containing protein n=1 Tax=Agrobacterium deltaense TaxID=1183412 RepID=UPI001FEF8590|nr:DUF736 family protein [Agrobacterium deltaense]
MAVIGEFTTNGNNSIIGNVRTLTVTMKARLNPIERTSRDAPDFRITAGNGVEVGAGWKAVSNDGEEYISVKLDDPSFKAPITRRRGHEGFPFWKGRIASFRQRHCWFVRTTCSMPLAYR